MEPGLDIGSIILGEGLQLDALTAPDTTVENEGTNTAVKTLASKAFLQKTGYSLTSQSLTCKDKFDNGGAVIASDKLHLVVNVDNI